MNEEKELIDETCDKYLCDTDHIIITGMSGGAVGVWSIVSKYGDYFSCAVPVSCGGYVDPESYKNVPVRAFVGGAADDYNTYYGSMSANVQSLKNAGMKLQEIELLELNEAFAAQSLGVVKLLSEEHGESREDILARCNVNGGAIALGHPVGASGNRIIVTLAHELKHSGKTYGVASLCIGGGMGTAVILKNLK